MVFQKSRHLAIQQSIGLTNGVILICFDHLTPIVSMRKKKSPNTAYIVPVERLERQIYLMRGQKVMLDYSWETMARRVESLYSQLIAQ